MDFGLPEGVTLNTDGTYNFAACPVLTLQTNDATMGTVDIQTVEREALVANLVAAELAGKLITPYLPKGVNFYGPTLATGAKEWINNGTTITGLMVGGNASYVIFYGMNARYGLHPRQLEQQRRCER